MGLKLYPAYKRPHYAQHNLVLPAARLGFTVKAEAFYMRKTLRGVSGSFNLFKRW